jgi:hypothetical protein
MKPEASDLNYSLCEGQPFESRQRGLVAVGSVSIAIVFPIIFLRFYSRYTTIGHLGWDDWITMIGAVCLQPNFELNIWADIVLSRFHFSGFLPSIS